MIKALTLPYNSTSQFFRAFLISKGITSVSPKALNVQVLHFFKCNLRYIVKEIKHYRPNLVVMHYFHYPKIAYNTPYMYLAVKKSGDFYKNLTVYSNNKSLSSLYLKKLELNYPLSIFTSESKYTKAMHILQLCVPSDKFKARIDKFKSKLMLE